MGKAQVTKERILEAAMLEFSNFGIAGARVDRIAKAAECNKNLIYVYFENKETLFTTVLSHYLTPAYEHLTFTPDDLGGYAGRVFDFSMANPALMRLLAWFNLEQQADSPAARANSHAAKIAALASAQEGGRIGSGLSPQMLLTVVMTLATAWTPANPFGSSSGTEAQKNLELLKSRVTAMVEVIARVT